MHNNIHNRFYNASDIHSIVLFCVLIKFIFICRDIIDYYNQIEIDAYNLYTTDAQFNCFGFGELS